jgi:plastocyanin
MRRHAGEVCSIALVASLLALAPVAAAADQTVTPTPANTFTPATVSVTQGESVTWTNVPGSFHNVHFDDGSFVQPPFVSASAWTVSRTFDDAGSFTYYCDAHLFVGMTGVVNVAAAPLAGEQAAGEPGPGSSSSPVAATAAPTCTSQRRFTIRLRGLQRVRVRSARAELAGKQIPVRREIIDGRRRHTAVIDLRGLPKGIYTAAITVTTAAGRVLRGARTYRTCTEKLTPGTLPLL